MSTFPKEDNPFSLETRLLHSQSVDKTGFNVLPTAVNRGSTVFFNNTSAQRADVNALGLDYSYGLHGNPTQYQLAKQLAMIEGALHTLVVPSGLNAIALVGLSLLKTGDHWLIPDNVYNPTYQLAKLWKADFGIEFDVYNPTNISHVSDTIRSNTKLIWIEAPGSLTFEIPDIAALVELCKTKHITSAIDNTWSAGLSFKPFDHEIDISIQALTKYQGGHSDVIMGSISCNNTPLFARIENRNRLLGIGVSPDDCSLVLRGLHTLHLRYHAQAKSAVTLAQWLLNHPSIERVLHPALPSCDSHTLWKKYFTGSASIFSFTLKSPLSDSDACSIVDRLNVFKIGYSWGGPESLALAMPIQPERAKRLNTGTIIRLAVGLENVDDLKQDLSNALNLHN